jgi:hypothetical protein
MNILKNDYTQAITARKALTGAIQALQDSSKHVSDKKRLSRLVEVIGVLKQESSSHDEVISRIDSMVANFDKSLISAASHRIYEIDALIKWSEGAIARKQKSYEDRVNEARNQHVRLEHYRTLDVEPTDEDRAANAAERAALLAEQVLLTEFMKDGPLFDIDRLKSTALAIYLPG